MNDDKRARLKELQGKLKTLTPDQRQSFIDNGMIATIEGRKLSLHNTLLCYVQSTGNNLPTVVGGFKQWLGAGRVVSKGQHGLLIWFPIGKSNDDEEVEVSKFYTATVFDISQTEALDTAKTSSGVVVNKPVVKSQPIPQEDNVMAGFRII